MRSLAVDEVFVKVAAFGILATAPAYAQKSPEQSLTGAFTVPSLIAAVDEVGSADYRAVSTLIDLASIVSPSGREFERAAAVADHMRDAELTGVRVDGTPNVVGTIPGTSGRALVFVTMLDDLPIIESFQRGGPRRRRKGDRVVGPATDIQSTVAAMLVAADAMVSSEVRTHHDLVFTAAARFIVAQVAP